MRTRTRGLNVTVLTRGHTQPHSRLLWPCSRSRRVEVVVDRDAEAVDVRAAVGARDVPLSGGDAELVLVMALHKPAPAEDSPHDGEDGQESEQYALYDHQPPGGVDVVLPQLLTLLQQPVPVEHPERVQVPGCQYLFNIITA